MGRILTEETQKFHAIAITASGLDTLRDALALQKGPVEIDIAVRGNETISFSFKVEHPAELIEILRLTSGK